MSSSREGGPIKYFFAGGCAGVCSTVVGHPFDTIKVRLQTQEVLDGSEKYLYSSMWDCAVKTVKEEGFRGLYRGMSAPLFTVTPIYAISFLGFGVGKRLQQNINNEPLTNLQLFYAGTLSGFFTTLITAPSERVKCLLQVQHKSKGPNVYHGPADVVKKLYKGGGVRSLYRGFVATLLRDIPASGMYFMTYECMQTLLKPKGTTEFDLFRTILAGGTAGMLNWCVFIPADVLKSRLQSAPEGSYPGGLKQAFDQLIKAEGFRALYTGCTPVMIRAFPANAACFMGFETCMMFLNWLEPNGVV